jgi:hypothetical protein
MPELILFVRSMSLRRLAFVLDITDMIEGNSSRPCQGVKG